MSGAGPKKVVGVGLACLDQLIRWKDAALPVHENRVLDFSMQGGGLVGTALSAVTRLGGRAEWWGAVGGDWMGRMVLDSLTQEGIDVSHARVLDDGHGPLVLVCVDGVTGERHFLHSVGRLDPQTTVGSLERHAAREQHACSGRGAAPRRARRRRLPVGHRRARA